MQAAERIKDFYNAYPFPGRLNSYGPWEEVAPKTLKSVGLPPSIVDGARMLDAGCGTGEYARSFTRMGANVVAIDLTPGAIARAQEIDKELGFQIDYRQADLLRLPSDLGSFDLIISLGVLHHTGDPEQAFYNLVEKLEDDRKH
jgi:2-polyprenyl-3-methyl-5-hydroxy-6-metoxy-1,4-benzoquinol methylase